MSGNKFNMSVTRGWKMRWLRTCLLNESSTQIQYISNLRADEAFKLSDIPLNSE